MKPTALLLSILSVLAVAETQSTSSIETKVAAPESKAIGTIEFRPSAGVTSSTDKRTQIHSENTLEAGYQFSKTRTLGYTQWWYSNVFNPGATSNGFDAQGRDGFVYYKMKDLYTDGNGLSLSYEPRLIMPTDAGKRNAGLVTYIRNNVTLKQKFNSLFSLSLVEIPIFHVYSRSGTVDAKGKATANPVFENRVYLIPELQITEKLSFSLPIMYHSTRLTGFQGASAKWTHFLWVWPELDYDVTKNYTVGVAYYSDNLIKSDLSDVALGSGIQEGMTQVILKAAL